MTYLKCFKDKLYINLTLESDVVHYKIQGFCFKHSWQQLIPNKEKTKMISYHLEAAAAQDFPSNQNACNFFSIFFVHVFLQDKSYTAKIFHCCIWINMKHERLYVIRISKPWRKLNIWHSTVYFWPNSRALDSQWATVSSVWFIFSIKTNIKK